MKCGLGSVHRDAHDISSNTGNVVLIEAMRPMCRYQPRPVFGLCVVLDDLVVDAADGGGAARPPEEPVAAEVHRVLVLGHAFAVQAHLQVRLHCTTKVGVGR